ncbi:hypothetical protein CW304_18590 [Bacillus sp. UFRGS-B20]|nr:hypothetical protein CW304_18590 [Bacillus sp. UFRGS-B20]
MMYVGDESYTFQLNYMIFYLLSLSEILFVIGGSAFNSFFECYSWFYRIPSMRLFQVDVTYESSNFHRLLHR